MGGLVAGGTGLGGYAVGVEPRRLAVTRYDLAPARWPAGLRLRIAVLADIHACEPWMSIERVGRIVEQTNALAPDLVLLLGDYVSGLRMRRMASPVPLDALAETLAGLEAPLGSHAVLGNHDWWELPLSERLSGRPVPLRLAFEAAGVPVLENSAIRLRKDDSAFWLAGLGDQWALFPGRGRGLDRSWRDFRGVDDLPGTLAKVTDDAPVLLMAHEPDIFPQVPERVSLTVSGHTHGGQVQILGYAPIVPSRYGRRYVYGLVVEDGRSLIVSGGIGCSGLPVRLGRPPEIVLIEIGREA